MIDVRLAKSLGDFSLDVTLVDPDPGAGAKAGVTALFGRSGSGKSLTLAMIAGLTKPDAGHIRIGGVTLLDTAQRIDRPSHRRRIGYVFQDSHLFPHLTVRQNLAFGRWFSPKAERRIAEGPVIETLGIGALLERRPATLSGGERQRVAIGRALIASPRLLLLDEPLAALDRQRKLDILPLIERVRDAFGVPIVYVSHALDEVVRLAAHVVVLDTGRVVASGDPATVLGRGGARDDPRFGRASVLATVLGEPDQAYGLTPLRHPAGTLWLAGTAGPVGRPVRALVRATDVSLAPPGETSPLSIRSSLVGRIAGIETDGPFAVVDVALEGGGTIVALVTRRALDDLSLSVGSPVRTLVKTVALDEGVMPGP